MTAQTTELRDKMNECLIVYKIVVKMSFFCVFHLDVGFVRIQLHPHLPLNVIYFPFLFNVMKWMTMTLILLNVTDIKFIFTRALNYWLTNGTKRTHNWSFWQPNPFKWRIYVTKKKKKSTKKNEPSFDALWKNLLP